MKKQSAQIELFPHVSFLDKLLFTKHLSIMIKSGITISEAIDSLQYHTKSPRFQKILKDIFSEIQNGGSLSKALGLYPKVFDHFYRSIIEVGEEAGSLEKNLEFLADEMKKSYELKKKVKGALIYPAIIITATLTLGVFLSVYVLPKLTDLFLSLDVELPLSTRILLFVSNAMKNYGVFIISGLGGLIGLFIFLIQLPKVKPYWNRILLRIPIVGPFIQYKELSELFRNMGIMIKSGLPITKSLEIQLNVSSNHVFRTYVAKIQSSVLKGKDLGEELSNEKEFALIPPLAVRMIEVGEKTGKIDETLMYLGDFYDEELDAIAKNLSTLIEPVLLLVIGLVVGFVALSIISPIYQLTGSIKR